MPIFLKLSKEEDAPTVEFLTLGELAKLCKRKPDSFKKLMQKSIMPDANYRTKATLIKNGARAGEKIPGDRLYSKDFLAPKLKEFFKKEMRQGRKVSIDMRHKLYNLFDEEKQHFTKK